MIVTVTAEGRADEAASVMRRHGAYDMSSRATAATTPQAATSSTRASAHATESHASDTIEVKEKSKQLAVVLDATQSSERDVPEYLEVDHRAMKGRFARAPKLSDVPYPVQMEPNLVVEFYSR